MYEVNQIAKVRQILNDILNGVISRKECSQGLCSLIDMDNNQLELNRLTVLHGYKYWSGTKGYIIYIGETTEKGIEDQAYTNEAIDQFKLEARNVAGYKDLRERYWEARLELARHWLRYLDRLEMIALS